MMLLYPAVGVVMEGTLKLVRVVAVAGLGAIAPTSCSDPDPAPIVGPEDSCPSVETWIPEDGGAPPTVDQYMPVPHPARECIFYEDSWQTFLIAMYPDASGLPAFLTYPTIDTLFQHERPLGSSRSYLGFVKQPGVQAMVIDQNGNSLYYGTHVNQTFAGFILSNHLDTAAELKEYAGNHPGLTFPAGIVEVKSAWQVVEGDAETISRETADYISFTTTLPTLSQDPSTREIREDRNNPRPAVMRLLAVHVAFTLPGHPEMIWSTFEHTRGAPDSDVLHGHRDVAPIIPDWNPPAPEAFARVTSEIVVSNDSHLLYKSGTRASEANLVKPEVELRLVGQKFLNEDATLQQTSIYRMFSASRSNTTVPANDVTTLNHNVEVLFARNASTDKRSRYRLVGTQWLDKPRYFDTNLSFQNDVSNPMVLGPHFSQGGEYVDHGVPIDVYEAAIREDGTWSEFSIVGGQDRLVSTAMESFVQGPESFTNCFACHNTQAVTVNGVPTLRDRDPAAVQLLPAGLLNVSHVLSQFMLEEYEASLSP